MKKTYCDACGKECVHPKRFSGPCHLLEFAGKLGYIDGEGNPTSGRSSEYDVCTGCWNRIYGAAAKAFFNIQNQTPHQSAGGSNG